MSDEEQQDYEREAERALFQEYRDVVGQFQYAVETERRFYLANEVTISESENGGDTLLEVTLKDVWVWDIYRPNRFAKNARILTSKDVNIEELNHHELSLPGELSLED